MRHPSRSRPHRHPTSWRLAARARRNVRFLATRRRRAPSPAPSGDSARSVRPIPPPLRGDSPNGATSTRPSWRRAEPCRPLTPRHSPYRQKLLHSAGLLGDSPNRATPSPLGIRHTARSCCTQQDFLATRRTVPPPHPSAYREKLLHSAGLLGDPPNRAAPSPLGIPPEAAALSRTSWRLARNDVFGRDGCRSPRTARVNVRRGPRARRARRAPPGGRCTPRVRHPPCGRHGGRGASGCGRRSGSTGSRR